MKYQVYAALIASASAGPYAEKINKHMPTQAETQAAEKKVEEWLNEFDAIVQETMPAVEARNRRIERSFQQHEKADERVWNEGVQELEENHNSWEEEVVEAQMEFEHEVTEKGYVAEWEKLVQEVATEMDKAHMDMKKIRLSMTLQKKNNLPSMSSEFHEKAPTPQEVEEAEAIIQGWFERGEKIWEDAQPGLKARDRRIMHAWERAVREEEQINNHMMDELIEAQMEFEEELMQAEHNFEEELNQNGTVADVKALEDKIEADLRTMKKFNKRVMSLKRRQEVMARANTKMYVNLGKISEEMARNPPKPAEWDAMKVKLVDWATRWEALAEKVKPIEDRRNKEIVDATEDHMEEADDIIEEMFEEWDRNDQEFFEDVMHAQEDMEHRLAQQGTFDKMDKLASDIEGTLDAAARSMKKMKNNMIMRQKIIKAQSLQIDVDEKDHHMYDEMTDEAHHI